MLLRGWGLAVWGVTSPSLDSMNPEPRLVSARTRSRSAWARAADTRLTRLFLLSRHTGAYGDVMGCVCAFDTGAVLRYAVCKGFRWVCRAVS